MGGWVGEARLGFGSCVGIGSLLLVLGCSPAPQPPAVTAVSTTSTQAILPPVVPQVMAPVPPELLVGKTVFDKTCGMCHGAGVGGAPRPGDVVNWAPRIAQGLPVLYAHAVNGFNGPVGFMPARGGYASLSDAQVQAAVDYMVALSRP